jgi:hypothetical protein
MPEAAIAKHLLSAFVRELGGVSPKTRHAYVNAARRFLKPFDLQGTAVGYAELASAMAKVPLRERSLRFGRIHRFERFLRMQGPHVRIPWIDDVERLLHRFRTHPFSRALDVRDLAFLACCAALREDGTTRYLSLQDVEEKAGALTVRGQPLTAPAQAALRRWVVLRRQTLRPEQARRVRRKDAWASSPLLFPAPDGKPLSRSARSNALRRFSRPGWGRGGFEPGAFDGVPVA